MTQAEAPTVTGSTVSTPQIPGPRRSASIGFLGGISGGLLGGGTGVVTVPALDRHSTLSRHVIHGTSTLANVSAAVVGSIVYALRGGHVDVVPGVGLMIGGVLGAYLGARWVSKVPEVVLRSLFVLVLLLSSTKFLLQGFGIAVGSSTGLFEGTALIIAVATVTGLVVGAYSAAMGLGGGLLVVPVMAVLFGADLHTAAGTSLLVMLPNAVVGAATHIRHGSADLRVGRPLALAALPGSLVGVSLALALPERGLAVVLGTFMAFLAVREVLRWRRTVLAERAEHIA
ncbi:sulfite exporter TauE/SafE family protein [Tsukamurella paurometabola]|uniref:Probable membrane transporter protein n=1 Tax=Tsukamurella paurometabola TaxID=2061 RepID=A0ABS5NG95_TSUPA|nr:sulfite exporter TauE/SafE family protein [Tsukamurella paurometabola]MBS4103320.1 sulfite exporter TauE/SafE family protein [Tsukamurella paurometabola]